MKRLIFTLLGIFIFTYNSVNAQEDRSAFWGNAEAYLYKQAFQMFELIDRALTENPPTIGSPMTRKLALYNLDAMLHETKYDDSEAFKNFIYSRTSLVISDLSKPVNEGMKIYKIYNEGFIARTQSVTIAFDLVRGSCKNQLLISDSLMRLLVEQCDILFITHNHGDHADPAVIGMFTEAGKPVIAPNNVMEDNKNIQHLWSEKAISKQIQSVDVKIFPGHQDDLPNNLYVVTTKEKKTIAHIGDQYNKDDMAWIVNLKKEIPQPDALIINCWTHQMNNLVEGFSPKLVIPGHENEMGHTIDHREAFWLTFQKMQSINRDYVVMGWGEWFQCK